MAHVKHTLSPQQEQLLTQSPPLIQLRGHVQSPAPCLESAPSLALKVNGVPHTTEDKIKLSAAQNLHTLSTGEELPQGWSIYYKVLMDGAQTTPNVTALDSRRAIFAPDVLGTYTLEVIPNDPNGVRTCDTLRYNLQVVPRERAYVELLWDAENDPITSDHGQGQGIDIDLYARVFSQDTEDTRPCWRDERTSCFASWPPTTETMSSCASSRAKLKRTSYTGALPEVLHFIPQPGERWEFGAHLSNKARYERASLRLRVWWKGERFELEERLEGQDSFWFVGTFDPERGLDTSQTYRQSGFPECTK